VATLGADGQPYLARLQAMGVDVSALRVTPEHFTAQAMIMTDRDNNQITAFHPGAMALAHQNPIVQTADVSIAILAPDGKQATWTHAEQLHAAGVPFVFDPGQGLPMFDGAELRQLVEWADWAALNDYEARLLCDRTGLSLAALSQRLRALVVTLGEHGCDVWQDGQCTRVPGERASAIVDPTGCGDAFRAALLYGLAHGWGVEQAARLGNRMGAAKIATQGGQNYRFSL
jgi:adenosine kinase